MILKIKFPSLSYFSIVFLSIIFSVDVALWNGVSGGNIKRCVSYLNWKAILQIKEADLENRRKIEVLLETRRHQKREVGNEYT